MAWTAAAQEAFPVCYNYDCRVQAEVSLSAAQLDRLSVLFAPVSTPPQERRAISRAMGLLAGFAAEQTPIWADRGGNYDDDGVDGRMDCIDHSINAAEYLSLFRRRGWLKFHTDLGRVRRGFIFVHWAARLRETHTGEEYAVDSWFFDNGHPAAVLPLRNWLAGADPHG